MVHYNKIHWINGFSHQFLMSSCLNKLELTGVLCLPPTLSLSPPSLSLSLSLPPTLSLSLPSLSLLH